jgi:hypothetical protein
MSREWALAWYNLIFGLPFAVALLYLFVYAASGLTFGEVEGDAEAEADADTDAGDAAEGHDAEAEADPDGDAGADDGGLPRFGHADVLTDPTPDGAPATAEALAAVRLPWYVRGLRRLGWDGPTARDALRFLGVGRVPLSVLLMALFFAWGFLGVATNVLVRGNRWFGDEPWLLSVPVALLGSVALARGLGRAFGACLPAMETYARGRAALAGRAGEAVLPIDQAFGLAVVRDARGTSHQVSCRVPAGAPPVEKGAAVRLADYCPDGGFYYVSPS